MSTRDPQSLPPEVERELRAIDDALADRPVDPELTELGRLAVELREDRPAPSEAFARRLDNQVRRRFPSPQNVQRTPWRVWIAGAMPAAAAVILVVVVGALVLSNAGGDDEAQFSGGSAKIDEIEERSGGDSGGGASRAAPESQSPEPAIKQAPAPTPRSDRARDRKVELTASLTLATPPDEFERTADEIVRVTDELGGYVLSSSVQADDREGGRATFDLRVPNRSQQRALAELSRLGHVRERAQSSRDITSSHLSARERVDDARAQRESLLRQLGGADTPNEAQSIRARLRDANRRLAAAQRSLQRVTNRATFSTIAVTLVSDPAAGEGEGAWSPGDAFNDAQRVLEVLLGVLMLVAAVALPFAVLLGLALAARRATIRRRRERVLEA